LINSAHPAMRHHAMILLQGFPPEVATGSIRKLLNDESHENRHAAALYLAKAAKDPDARSLMLKSAKSSDPKVAVLAVKSLGRDLTGADVNELLNELLEESTTPKPVLVAAIRSAGSARIAGCGDALVGLLDNHERLDIQKRGGDLRVCDLAAWALEATYRINQLGVKGGYGYATIEKRDQGVARWKEWYAEQSVKSDPQPRETYVARLIEESLTKLAATPEPQVRRAIKARLENSLQTSFCLGDLPGVDAVVSPSVRDVWKIMRVSREGWRKYLKPWQSLQSEYDSKLLPEAAKHKWEPDEQALRLILIAESLGEAHFPKVWVWSFCGDFARLYPDSAHLAEATEVKTRAEAEFRKRKLQVVLHAHIPVLEPVAREGQAKGGMEPVGYTALYMKVSEEPSNWSYHRAVVEHYRRTFGPKEIQAYVDYPILHQQEQLFPGNEYPYLGAAVYQSRVRKEPELGLEFADKAAILNPNNAKVHAIRGMIRLAFRADLAAAAEDLVKAFQLDPKSLGDEPETRQAAIFLFKSILESEERPRAQEYSEALGGLTPFGSTQPVRETPEYKALLQALMEKSGSD